jgi:hypothetical protein
VREAGARLEHERALADRGQPAHLRQLLAVIAENANGLVGDRDGRRARDRRRLPDLAVVKLSGDGPGARAEVEILPAHRDRLGHAAARLGHEGDQRAVGV